MKRKWEYIHLGFRSFGRLGRIPFLGLLLAFVLLFQGIAIFREVENEKQQPVMLTAVCRENGSQLCEQLGITEGVQKAAEVIPLSAQLCLNDDTCELELYGVDSSWLDSPWAGVVYPAESSMPWVVLNQAALAAFANIKGESIEAEEIQWQGAEITVNGYIGEICGITDDERSEVCGYVSAQMAKYLIRNGAGETNDCRVFIQLKEASYIDRITGIVKEQGAYISENGPWDGEKWEQEIYRARLNLICAVGVFALTITLMIEKTRRDIAHNQDEYQFLMDYGAVRSDIRALLAARTMPVVLFSIIGAMIIRALMKM